MTHWMALSVLTRPEAEAEMSKTAKRSVRRSSKKQKPPRSLRAKVLIVCVGKCVCLCEADVVSPVCGLVLVVFVCVRFQRPSLRCGWTKSRTTPSYTSGRQQASRRQNASHFHEIWQQQKQQTCVYARCLRSFCICSCAILTLQSVSLRLELAKPALAHPQFPRVRAVLCCA